MTSPGCCAPACLVEGTECADRRQRVEGGFGRARKRALTSGRAHVPFRAEFSREQKVHRYRTHTCGELRASDIGVQARLAGWCHRIRDHGGLLFIDLRDHYGITQIVADPDTPAFKEAEKLRSEWVGRIDGK